MPFQALLLRKRMAKRMGEMEPIPSEKFKYRYGNQLIAKLITPLNDVTVILPEGLILWLFFHQEAVQVGP